MVEEVSSSDFSCKLMLPRTRYIFGTSITADFGLTPMRGGLSLRSAVMEVFETKFFRTFSDDQPHLANSSESSVARRELEVPEAARMLPFGVEVGSHEEASYLFRMTLPLPRSLRQCRQSTTTPWITIRHWLRLAVNVQDPDGHVEQVSTPGASCYRT